ncbi:hypothetical protein NM688_g5373 [Phlebia brevispora]|uniref:Uncharacterized protein n=1 Tax=Phlebia brevispora TaxID=194682 RepID=A0ACC1SW51_9APHY|nr:hypothetical protein NM688_g5373 [Phlebia brevispora]
MPQKISPNRRRSIAVLNQGGGSSKASHRRRAYSMAPGEKLSPAARARKLVPRKSILKGSVNPQPSRQDQSATTADSTDVTQSMDLTEIQPTASRKSLGRRVSFASHAHVRLFEVQDPNASGSVEQSPAPGERNDNEVDDEDDDVRTLKEIPPQNRRRSSQRRRSSTAFSEFGEQSMDMDEGDSALDPQDFLNTDAESFRDDEEEEEEDYEDGEDMDMTEAIPREFIRKRSLSLGGPSQSFIPRRRSSVALATSSSSHSENQVHPPPHPQLAQQQTQTHESIYPSLQLEDILNLPPEEQDNPHEPEHPNEDVTSSTMQFGTEGEDMTESSGGDNTQPMEFTIPVVRPPPPPSKEWLQLRAMTHAGSEPYEPPPHEPSDDPEANAIVPMDNEGDEAPMELTDALNRLQKARSSLVLPPHEDSDEFNPHHNVNEDDTFTSTEDSFNDEFDGDRTINVTKLRQSLGAASMRDESMDLTSVYGEEGASARRESGDNSREARGLLDKETPQISLPATSSAEAAKSIPAPPPVFSLPSHPRSSVLPRPSTAATSASPPIFSLPTTSSTSTVVSAPARAPQTQIPLPPKSPSRAVPTVPKPFTFSLDSRLGTPSKGKEPEKAPAPTPASPSKLPIHRGTAAFAPPSAPKSPRKRAAPPDNEPGDDRDFPSPAKKQAVGRLSPSKTALFEHPPASTPAGNHRTSSVRRPSGYFAQRKSLGGATLSVSSSLPNLGSQTSDTPQRTPARRGLQQRASLGAAPSEHSAPLYPDLSRIEESAPSTPKAPAELYPDISGLHESPPVPPVQAPNQIAEIADKGAASNESEATLGQSTVILPGGFPSSQTTNEAQAPRSSQPVFEDIVARSPSPPPIHLQTQDQQVTPADKYSPPVPEPQRLSIVPEEQTDYEEDGEDEGEMELTEQWREGLHEADEMYTGEEPSISVEQFFQMTGIRFMDELTAPRRSTIHPGQLRQNRRRSLTSSHSEEAEPVPLAEFMSAMAVDVPQLELYSVLANELNAWIEQSKQICRQAEEDSIKFTPALFREFAEADESEKADLVHQLKLIKANNIGAAKSQWYDWKSQWTGQLQNSAAEAFSNLEGDAKVLEDIIKQAQTMLPDLRAEFEQAAHELEKEEADVAELQNSDKDYLNELKVSIAEQDVELQAFRANVAEADAKLKRLNEKLAEIEAQKQENNAAIAQAERIVHIQTESTSSEVFRLREELDALQDLHLWRSIKLQPDLIELEYASRYTVSIPCANFRPKVAQLTISRTKGSKLRERDPFPQLTQLMLDGGRHVARDTSDEVNIRKIVQRLGDFWSSCAQIRCQLTFLSIKYPLSVQVLSDDNATPYLKTTATVLFPTAKSKAYISFVLDYNTYAHWPLTISSLKTDVKVAYGPIEQQKILDAVSTRLSQATPSESHGCLLDACIEATEQFAQT